MLATRPRDPERTRLRLLLAAEKDFAANGFAGARTGRIARAAGVNQRMLYHYFGSKEGIWEAVYRELTEWLQSRLLEDLKSRPPAGPLDTFAQAIRTYFDLIASRPAVSRILMYETLRGLKTFLKVNSSTGEPAAPLLAALSAAMHGDREPTQVRGFHEALNAFAVGTLFANVYPLMRDRYAPYLESIGIPRAEQDGFAREALIDVLTFGIAARKVKEERPGRGRPHRSFQAADSTQRQRTQRSADGSRDA
jgi:AcrR family transcriptional regulator